MEIEARPPKQLLQVIGDIPTTKVDSLRCVFDAIPFINSTCTAHTISNIQNHTSHHAPSVETQHWGRLEEEAWHTKSIEHELRSLDTVAQRVQWILSQQDRVLFWIDFKFVEDVPIDGLHIFPVFYSTVLNRVA